MVESFVFDIPTVCRWGVLFPKNTEQGPRRETGTRKPHIRSWSQILSQSGPRPLICLVKEKSSEQKLQDIRRKKKTRLNSSRPGVIVPKGEERGKLERKEKKDARTSKDGARARSFLLDVVP